jgi:hypothetical protein
MTSRAMSAGTAETQSGSGRQPASAVANGDGPQPTDNAETIMTEVQQAVPVAGDLYELFMERARELFMENGGKHSSNCQTAWQLLGEFARLTEPARKADSLGEGVGLREVTQADKDCLVSVAASLACGAQELAAQQIACHRYRSTIDPTHTREAVDVRKLVTDALHDHQLGNRAGIRDRLIEEISAALSAGSAQ